MNHTPALVRYAWLAGAFLLLLDFLVVFVPASQMGGRLHVAPFLWLAFFGIVLIAISVIAKLIVLNRETQGAVVGLLKAAGTGYVVYKGGIAVARHLHQEITRDDN